ncbi:MAG: aminotransferase class IV [Anaerovoracaceae bacterium]|jgi:branched-chain amino acid aminotransferase
MADQAMLKKFMMNGTLYDTKDFDNLYKAVQPSCYEVIRVIDGRPLFLDEHFERFTGTVKSIDKPLPLTLDELESAIRTLAKENEIRNYNVKLIYNDFEHGGKVFLFFTPTSYPTEEMYRDGVKTDFLRIMRDNPHAKIINQNLRDTADRLMKEEGLFEAVLVDDNGKITEGSKSNIFFIQGDHLVTCPAEGVLLGVTRQRILRLTREAGIETIEEQIDAERASEYDAAFISGTSPKVLPIAVMGDVKFDVNNALLRRVMKIYDDEIKRYLAS